ncbi:LytR/AlgR family response regulator transcription factor [Myroides guanonis]|uniref:Two component transcriptional regulator, LytTR family n=1 Tax=Myroides guanonis TaxID=1150112 RepID=A0A1I3SUC0_9FLAO|nr:LytTR family DNA-binding domain-containing protein [Myroides guanonis]SFJ61449.1 two component transcriptional regulator, LytTR family [Myroides guanonis]
MKVAIVEDETLASAYLRSLLEEQSILEIHQIIQLSSIKEAVFYFADNKVDLIFMDIHLGDGKSLDIFEQVSIQCPVIFVTAYDNYAIKAFKQFTIDYILKPYEESELHKALQKFKTISQQFQIEPVLNHLIQVDNALDSIPKQRFLVNHGYKLKSIEEQEIAYFSASGKHLFLYTLDGNHYIYQDTIKDVIKKLNADTFFRINRKYIVNYKAIREIVKHNSQKIEILLSPTPSDTSPILVSKNLIHEIKTWLNR